MQILLSPVDQNVVDVASGIVATTSDTFFAALPFVAGLLAALIALGLVLRFIIKRIGRRA